MSLLKKAARGAAWTIVFGLLARAIGVSGTLLMTHLIDPDVMGEASAAWILCMIFAWISNLGFGQYMIVKGRGDIETEVTWHCTVANLTLGAVALLAVSAVGGHFMPWFQATDGERYIPGMALALAIKRVGGIAEKVLVRNMQFRAMGISMAAGETVYAASAVFLAWRGYGGMAIVYGNIVQSTVVLLILVSASGFKSWLTPTKLSWARFRDMLRFGVPLGVEGIAHNASRYCDNLLMSRYFGPGSMALYNMGYNLADIPAVYVGEQIGSVLLPSLASMPRERRPAALERAAGLLALIIFPMAVGLACIAPTLIAVALAPKWQGVAPLLEILAALAVFRPITWALSSYLESVEQTHKYMWLEISKLAVLFGGIAILQRWGIQAAAVSVGIAFGSNAIAGVYLVATGPEPRPSPKKMFGGFARPLAACGVMALVVMAVRSLIPDMRPGVRLPLEIVSGAITYVVAAFALARPIANDFIHLVKATLRK